MRTTASASIFVFLVGVAAILWFALDREPAPNIASHRETRQLVVHFTVNHVAGDPIVVLGDSIVEASTLPRMLCGHPIVNAGLSGASTASDLGAWLSGALAGNKAAMIVVSLGTNDALTTPLRSADDFQAGYRHLLDALSALSTRLAILEIPAMETKARVTDRMRAVAMDSIDRYNALLPAIAARPNTVLVNLPTMTGSHTIDGVHLNAVGYDSWSKAVLQAADAVCRAG